MKNLFYLYRVSEFTEYFYVIYLIYSSFQPYKVDIIIHILEISIRRFRIKWFVQISPTPPMGELYFTLKCSDLTSDFS